MPQKQLPSFMRNHNAGPHFIVRICVSRSIFDRYVFVMIASQGGSEPFCLLLTIMKQKKM